MTGPVPYAAGGNPVIADSLARVLDRLNYQDARRAGLPQHYEDWLRFFFPNDVSRPFAPYHHRFWNWVWGIEPGIRPRPFVAIWPRAAGKSTSAELAAVALLARGVRRYVLYVRRTQDLANTSVSNIRAKLMSDRFATYFPELASRRSKTKDPWNRSLLVTESGAVVQALGLDVTVRGAKIDELRPDLIILDDIDDLTDADKQTRRKIEVITKTILPAGSSDAAIMVIQNLIISDGVVAQLADGRADFLMNRIVDGPIPAIRGLVYQWRRDSDGKTRAYIISGEPTWPEGYGIEVAQRYMNSWGLSAFLSEAQHETQPPAGGLFSNLEYERIVPEDVPPLRTITLWCDPAVTSTDRSDANGIQADGLGLHDKRIYRLFSFEDRSTPEAVLRMAILKANELRNRYLLSPDRPESHQFAHTVTVGVETDQGGDVWRDLYLRIAKELYANGEIDFIPRFYQAKAGTTRANKTARASLMLAEYLNGRFIHVVGTHRILEAALWRFPLSKPFDLVDAAYWSYHYLNHLKQFRIAFI